MSSKQGTHVRKVPRDGKESPDRIRGPIFRAHGGQRRLPISIYPSKWKTFEFMGRWVEYSEGFYLIGEKLVLD